MPTNVLYTINNLHTAGMRYVVADLVRHLDRRRFCPLVAVNRKTGSKLERDLEDVCPVLETPLRLRRRPRRTFPRALWLSSRRLRHLADIAFSFDYASDWTEGAAMSLGGIPWVAVKTNLSWGEGKWWLRSFFAQRIVCLSPAQARMMRRWERKIVIIPTGVDVERFARAQPLRREDFGLDPSDVVLGCIAHLVPVKGHCELLQALGTAAESVPRLKLLLAGDGERDYTAKLKDLSDSLGIGDRVLFLGNCDQVPALLKMCDGKILPTRNVGRREAFGAALVEAMAAGLPVIATRSGGPEDIIVDGETGWLLSAEGFEPLVPALQAFYASAERRQRYGAAGQERARRLYDLRSMVRRYEAVCDEVLRGRQG